jgi:hypothetical protein
MTRSRATILATIIFSRRDLAKMSGWSCCCGGRSHFGCSAIPRLRSQRGCDHRYESCACACAGDRSCSYIDVALSVSSDSHNLFGNYELTGAERDELAVLAKEKGPPFWRALEMMNRGWFFALTDKAGDAVHAITSGITAYRSTGAILFIPWYNLAFGESVCGAW